MANILSRQTNGSLLGGNSSSMIKESISRPVFNQSGRTDRASAEAVIADNNKAQYWSFTKAVNAPSVLCTYFPINEDYTSYSESTKNIKDNASGKKFDMIKNFVIYERDSEDLQDVDNDERRLSINLSPKTSFIQPGVLRPKEGDHLVLTSQGSIAKPYQVTKVVPRKFLDREIWEIQYSESTIFTLDGLLSKVVRRRVYISDNVGTNSAVIVDEDKAEKLSLVASIIDKLNTKFIETFYDEKYDQLVFKPYGFDNYHFNYYANDRMQQTLGLFKYGYDKNTLFIRNIYDYDAVESNYDNSLYTSLLDRLFYKKDEIELDDSTVGLIQSQASEILLKALSDRENIFGEYRGVRQYDSKYLYNTRLYLRSKANHMILTRYYNSKVTLVDMFDSAGYFDTKLKQSWVEYTITSPYICKFLDWFMDGSIDCIISNISLLKRYSPSKYCIDDYLGVPLLILALQETLNTANKSNDYGTYV